MATLPDIAKETGLDPLVCGSCGRRIRTTKLIRGLFSSILSRLCDGETVRVRGFGTFKPARYQLRGFAKSLGSGVRRIVRFNLTPSAKAALNSRR